MWLDTPNIKWWRFLSRGRAKLSALLRNCSVGNMQLSSSLPQKSQFVGPKQAYALRSTTNPVMRQSVTETCFPIHPLQFWIVGISFVDIGLVLKIPAWTSLSNTSVHYRVCGGSQRICLALRGERREWTLKALDDAIKSRRSFRPGHPFSHHGNTATCERTLPTYLRTNKVWA